MAEPYTDADVELVRGAAIDAMSGVAVLYCPHPGDEGPACPDCITERVLSVLAAARRLTPADAESRTEWASDHMHRTYAEPVLFPVGANRDLAETRVRYHTEHGRPSRLLSRAIVVGPWLPVPTEEDTDGR